MSLSPDPNQDIIIIIIDTYWHNWAIIVKTVTVLSSFCTKRYCSYPPPPQRSEGNVLQLSCSLQWFPLENCWAGWLCLCVRTCVKCLVFCPYCCCWCQRHLNVHRLWLWPRPTLAQWWVRDAWSFYHLIPVSSLMMLGFVLYTPLTVNHQKSWRFPLGYPTDSIVKSVNSVNLSVED